MTTVLLVLLALVGFAVALLVRRRGDMSRTVHAWELGLLYVNGRFAKVLEPGRYWTAGFDERLVVTLPRNGVAETIYNVEVTSAERLSYRLSAIILFEIADPRVAHEGGYREMLRLAVSEAVVQLAAARSVETVLSERQSLGPALLAMLDKPICGCGIKEAFVSGVALPPELRRLYAEVERARLEGQAALERARGEQAALRSLANAARMLKGNPELMNLRLLQALSSPGGKGTTLVLGRDAFAATEAGPARESQDPDAGA